MSELNTILNADDVVSLSSARVDQSVVDVNGRTPLHRAVAAGSTDCALWLIDQSNEAVNLADKQGETPLMRAAGLGNAVLVDALVARGANLDAQALTGGTALHYAHGGTAPTCKEVVNRLVAAGAKSEVTDKSGRTPEQWSAQAQAIAAGEAVKNPPKPRVLSIKRR